MRSASVARTLKDADVGCGHHVFNVLLVVVMKVSFLTFFILTPQVKQMSDDLSIGAQALTLIAVVYESGKFFGLVLIGRMCDSYNMLRTMMGSMLAFIVIAVILYGFGFLEGGLQTYPVLNFAVFMVLYFTLSILCIAPQFGLAILKKTNSAARCKRYVMLQGLAACILQGVSVPCGQFIGQLFGWQSVFLFLAVFVGLVTLGLFATSTREHYEACKPRPSSSLPLTAEPESESYWSKVRVLVCSAEQRTFQAFNIALGIATANLYMLPLYGQMLLTNTGTTKGAAAALVCMTFIGNFCGRLTSLLVEYRCSTWISGVSFVLFGMLLLVLGSILAVFLVALTPSSGPHGVAFMVYASVLQLGVGFVLPNGKAGAVLEVPGEYDAAANSILKMSQLIFTAVAQGTATVAGCNEHSERFVALLLVWNAVGASGLLWWRCRHGPRNAVAAGESPIAPTSTSKTSTAPAPGA